MKQTCNVSNKSAGRVVYKIPELNLRRVYYPHETKRDVPVAELEKLSQMDGGRKLLYNYLMVDDPDVIYYLLNREVPPEYWFHEDKIPSWMNSCSLDEFKDALDFAPRGTLDLIKKYAVDMPLNDASKRQAIKDQLGFDVNKAIELTAPDKDEEVKPVETKQRRVATTEEPPKRRVQLPIVTE